MAEPGNTTCHKCNATIALEPGKHFCGACVLEIGLDDGIDAQKRSQNYSRDLGDYEILEELGRGGQAVVYRARQKSLNRVVALKVIGIGPWATGEHLKRFRKEAEAVAKLEHPRIVPIYEIGDQDGFCFFSMKLVAGGRLDEVARRHPMTARRAAELVARLARTVHFAHQHGILHRDIKPGNILLDAEGEPHLADFGLAKLVENDVEISHTTATLGTPSYMSPEQARATERLTTATDIYGLGAVFYHLLTGSPPFAGGTTYETISQLLKTEPRKPSLFNRQADRDLETICLKCLEKEPAKRYASAEALAEDLERWLRYEPILARRSGPIERARKWIRRNPVASKVIPAAAVIVIGFIILWRHSVQSPPEPESLAVVIRPADSNSTFFANVFSPQLIRFLSGISDLRVSDRGNVLKWESSKDSAEATGRALHVKELLFGELRVVGQDFHLDLELINPRSGARLWQTNFTRSMAEAPHLQAQLTRTVAATLRLDLTEKGRDLLRAQLTGNTNAWTHYMRARQQYETLSEAGFKEAIQEFETATNNDPRFAQAYAGLAAAHFALGYNFHEPLAHFVTARSHLQSALALDATLPEAKLTDGLLKYFSDWDWEGATRALDEALRLDPHMVEADACYLHCEDVFGRADQALRKVQEALALHPTSIAIESELGCAAYYAGRFDEGATYSRITLRHDPDNVLVHYLLARSLVQLGRDEEALTTLQSGATKPGGDWSALQSEIAYIHARRGEKAEARRIMARLREREKSEYIDPYLLAVVYAGLGEMDEAIAELKLACDHKSTWIPSVMVEPKFAELRRDPRFQAIVERLKLPGRSVARLEANSQ